MLNLNVVNETSKLKAVVLGTAVSLGPAPKLEDCIDPKSREHVLNNTYPVEEDLIQGNNLPLDNEKIEDIDIWGASLDKDFEEERNNNPHVFDYQSKHYVVKLKNSLEYQGVSIEKGTACEIQVRTLMQHAYSELSHDVLYKPKSTISKKTTRSLTRSVALIETVDEYFSEASKGFEVESSLVRDCFLKLKALYQEKICTSSYDIKTNIFLLSHFENKLDKLDLYP